MARETKSSRVGKKEAKKVNRSAKSEKFVENRALKHSSSNRKQEGTWAIRKRAGATWNVQGSATSYPTGEAAIKQVFISSSTKDVALVKDSVLTVTSKPEVMMTPMEKMKLAQEGVPKNALESLKDKAGLDYTQLSQLLNVARTTLIAKKGKEKFSQDISDKILGLADIYSYGYEVFEERERFNEWIFRSNRALGGQAPFDVLHNTFGKEEVKNLIGRIDYGIYS